tara:strand:+ start:1413 stop:1868 length:456 start_codon:yes stop_codon:yes gene_type:complete
MMIAMITLIVAAAKKKQSRWRQMTLTGGHPKGATDWLKPGTKVRPQTIQIGTGEEFENDGWKIPDFLAEKMKQVFVIIFDADLQKRPLLINQKSAVMAVLLWLREITSTEHEENGIEIVTTDEPWELVFKKGKKQFDPYTMTANDISEGGA